MDEAIHRKFKGFDFSGSQSIILYVSHEFIDLQCGLIIHILITFILC